MPKPLTPDEPIAVTQEDREAAAAFARWFRWGSDECLAIEEGLSDEAFIVQAFARHRVAHTPSQTTYSEAIEAAAKVAEEWSEPLDYVDELVAAIRALSPPQPIDRAGVEAETLRRVEYAANQIHNSRDWYGEPAPDGNGSLWDWIARASAASPTTNPNDGLAGDDLLYLVRLADWAAGQGLCQIEGLEDPEEWCFRKWEEVGPPSGEGYSPEALAACLTRIDARLATKGGEDD